MCVKHRIGVLLADVPAETIHRGAIPCPTTSAAPKSTTSESAPTSSTAAGSTTAERTARPTCVHRRHFRLFRHLSLPAAPDPSPGVAASPMPPPKQKRVVGTGGVVRFINLSFGRRLPSRAIALRDSQGCARAAGILVGSRIAARIGALGVS